MWPDCFVIIYKLHKDYLTHQKNLAAITLLQTSVCKALRDFLILFLRKPSTLVKMMDPFLTAKFMTLDFMQKSKTVQMDEHY